MTLAQYETFVEFGAYCYEQHAYDLWVNASTLVRTGLMAPGRSSEVESRVTSRRFSVGLEGAFVRSMLRRLRYRPSAPLDAYPVLFYLPFDRRDYDSLMQPYVMGLADRGVRCVVVVPRPAVDRWKRDVSHERVTITTVGSAPPCAAYWAGRRTVSALRPVLADALERFRVPSCVRHDLYAYFVAYAFEKAMASQLLSRFKPSVVVGLHFVSNRGWQAAIAQSGLAVPRPRVVLVQHGAVTATSGFHDFEGADLVLLWGERWQREVERLPSHPFCRVPSSIVTGNPKFDGAGRSIVSGGTRPLDSWHREGSARVLYVSSHVGGKTLVSPLSLAAHASIGEPGFRLIVKPHPAERDDTVTTFVEQGELAADAILAPQMSINAAVLEVDVVVGPESTALFDAARFGKPVILIADAPSPAYEGFVTVSDAAMLHDTVQRLMRDPHALKETLDTQSHVLRDAFGPTEEPVSRGVERILDLIEG